MSIVTLEGVQGSGKTTAAVAFVTEEHKNTGRKIISNVHLNTDYVQYTHFDLEFFIEHLQDHEMEDCLILLDETYQIFDARSSGTKLNKLMSYFFVQTRKRGVDLYICTHNLDHIDKRGRRAADVRGACRFYGEDPCRRCKGTGIYQGVKCDKCYGWKACGEVVVNCFDRRIRKRYSLPFWGPDYWHLFLTRERIPFQEKMIDGIDVKEMV